MSFKIVTERRTGKKMSDAMMQQQLQHCADLALKGGRGRGWTYKIMRDDPQREGGEVVHRCILLFMTTSDRASLSNKWPAIIKRFAEAGSAGSLRSRPWCVVEPTGYSKIAEVAKEEQTKSEERKKKADEPKSLGEINLDPGDNFDRIFGRHAQLRRIMDSLMLAKQTDWRKRKNTLLDGPVGGGKSELMLAIAKMLGEENVAWRWFDATGMTKAGAIEEIIESSVVPPVLFIEEIEKTEENALRWLLGVMDTRGEIRRTNYRVGNQARNVRMVVIASANNVQLLKSVMSGALYSRFQNKIYCPQPDRVIMRQILEREIEEMDGNPAWIEPALQLGFDKWGISDPRELQTICCCGGDRLLTGNYQRDYEETMHPQERRDLLRKKKKLEAKEKPVNEIEE